MFNRFAIDSLAFHESIMHPAFADIVPQEIPYSGSLREFTLMDDVVSKRHIVDIRRVQNIMQRRDASCDINYKKVMTAGVRQVTVDEIYGATQFCRSEFYKGALKDWRNDDPIFADKILPFFRGAVSVDLASNSYFGDTDRVVPVNSQWSTGAYDGIFKWIKRYTTAGVIPSDQTITIANGTDFLATPVEAYNVLKALYDRQKTLMNSFDDSQKAFYVSKEIKQGYEDYLISVGLQASGYTLIENGVKAATFKGIPVLEEPIWTPIITEIKGSKGYAAILTLRGNFVFATDKTYGEGEDGKTALEVFYDKKEMQFYYRMFLKSGTQIALPEYVYYALSSWS